MSAAVGARGFTTRFAVSRYLFEQVEASDNPAFAGTTRSWGYPGEDAGDEIVWVGGVDRADQEAASIGRGTRQEDYTVAVYLDVALDTADPADVNARLEALTHAVEALVHADARLGGLVVWAQVTDVSTVRDTGPATGSTYGGVVLVRVACEARI